MGSDDPTSNRPNRGIVWWSRIGLLFVVLLIWSWAEESIVEEIETPSDVDDGTVGNVVKYTCSARIEDYLTSTSLEPKSMACPRAPKTIWIVGFPGSGIELVRRIVRTVTGMNIDDTFFDDGHVLPNLSRNCQDWSPVRITDCPLTPDCPLPKDNPNKKDKSPTLYGDTGPQIEYHTGSILLVRNPTTAVPSHVTLQYQKALPKPQQHKDNLSPPPQAPEHWWDKNRAKYLHSYLNEWERLIVEWTVGRTTFFPTVNLVLAHERLLSPHYGPNLIQQVADELRSADSPIRVISPNATMSQHEIYYCLWELIASNENYFDPTAAATRIAQQQVTTPAASKKKKVRKKDKGGDNDSYNKHGKAYQPGYTKAEYEKISDLVEHVIHEELATDSKNPQQQGHRTELMHILNDYRRDLTTAISSGYIRIVNK